MDHIGLVRKVKSFQCHKLNFLLLAFSGFVQIVIIWINFGDLPKALPGKMMYYVIYLLVTLTMSEY